MSAVAEQPRTGTQRMTYREALRLALREELARDERVFIMGEEVGVFEGSYKVTAGLMDEFGADRVVDTPLSESGIIGTAIGLSLRGWPIERLWLYLSGSALLILVGLQLALWWLIMSVLAELSGRTVGREA